MSRRSFVWLGMLVLFAAGAATLSWAAEESVAEDNFLTSAINSVFDKVNKVTSGEESIIIRDYNKGDERPADYATDALGRKIQEPTIRTTGTLPGAKDDKAKAEAQPAPAE